MEKGRNCSDEKFLLLSTIFSYLILDFYVKTRIRFSLRDKRLFEITEVKITRVDCDKKHRGVPVHLELFVFFQVMYYGDFDFSDRLRLTDHGRYFTSGSHVTTLQYMFKGLYPY